MGEVTVTEKELESADLVRSYRQGMAEGCEIIAEGIRETCINAGGNPETQTLTVAEFIGLVDKFKERVAV